MHLLTGRTGRNTGIVSVRTLSTSVERVYQKRFDISRRSVAHLHKCPYDMMQVCRTELDRYAPGVLDTVRIAGNYFECRSISTTGSILLGQDVTTFLIYALGKTFSQTVRHEFALQPAA